MNYGLNVLKQIEDQLLPEKHLMGLFSPYKNIVMQHPFWLPSALELAPETQFGKRVETFGCTGYGTNNILELIFFQQYGLRYNLSDRFLNKVSGTTREGNTVDAPIDAIRKYGFLFEHEWPWDRDNYDWDEYYAEIPQHLMDLALTRLDLWEFAHEYVQINPNSIKKALRTSPIGGTVEGWFKDTDGLYKTTGRGINHFATTIIDYVDQKYWLCLDSYPEDQRYDDNPQEIEFIKKLDWNYQFGCLKRYKITAKAAKVPTLTEKIYEIYKTYKGCLGSNVSVRGVVLPR